MTDYQKYINALRKCAKEHENDRTFTGHVIVADLCRDTANLLEELEQEPVLDKIRAEIFKFEDDCRLSIDEYPSCKQCTDNVFKTIYNIFDKYRK